MSRWKYRRLMSQQPGPILPAADDDVPFDIERLRARGIKARLLGWLFRKLLWPILKVLQRIAPVARFGDLVIVTSEADVRTILADTSQFRVPFGPEMRALAGGDTFVLGLDGQAHLDQRDNLNKVVLEEDTKLIEDLSRRYANALLDAGKGRIDAQRDLMTRVAAEVCARYMGLVPRDADSFAEWSLAASNLLFADPQGSEVAGELAAKAGVNLRAMVDRALENAQKASSLANDTLAGRLVRLEGTATGPTRGESRAILIGLAVGFVPTNSLAGGKMLGLLARHRGARAAALDAARKKDDATLRRVLLEAGRLDPALAPGQWRWCPKDADFKAANGRTYKIPAQTLVLASTMAALRDPDAWPSPSEFRIDRSAEPELLFGHLTHHCLGKELALAQIIPTIAELLSRPGVEHSLPRMKMRWLGPFPDRAVVEYDAPSVDPKSKGIDQNGLLFAVPMQTGESPAAINTRIDQAMQSIGWRDALDKVGLVHFLSLTAIETTARSRTKIFVMIEINCDGTAEAGGHAAIDAISAPLREILELEPADDLWAFLRPHRVAMHGKPWGATALNFFGLPGLSVREIADHHELATYAREVVDACQRRELGRSSRPAALPSLVRRLIRQDAVLCSDTGWQKLAARGAHFDKLLLKPRDRHLPLSDWDPGDQSLGWLHVARSGAAVQFYLSFVLLWGAATVLLYLALDPGRGQREPLLLSLPWLALQGFASAAVLIALVAAAFIALLRWKETRDPVDREPPALAHLRALAASEDLPGHVKNHITVVTPLKRGLLRRLTLALALWGIRKLVSHFYRPGFVLSMGTIQFARWVRLPGTGTMIFQSNYDGSWESYLEDFITRAHAGQTAAWSNCAGFPRTRFLILDGAEDGDSFKHYVRRKQVPTAFWYSRFPGLTADQIRRNALIHDGLARATSDSEARAWLSLFGSAPRGEDEIESEEVQAVVFNGFAKLPHADYLMFALPEDRDNAARWLQALIGYRIDNAEKSKFSLLADLLDPKGWLRPEYRLTFGEKDSVDGAAAIGLSARGLALLLGDNHPAIDHLPGPFAMGMEERAGRLGDRDHEAPSNWRWTDGGDQERGVDVVLTLYSPDPARHKRKLDFHVGLARLYGLRLVDAQSADPLEPGGFPRDHFGFRDGIVQPVIAGAIKADRERNPDDVIATGEMIYGYRNAQGFFPPSITVTAERDPHDLLPDIARAAERYPRFGKRRSRDRDALLRDFGRNGSFMAIRVLQQHPELFEQTCREAAQRIKKTYLHIGGAVGVPVDAEWVAAKMVGRWKSGASLIGNPTDPDAAFSRVPASGPTRKALAMGSPLVTGGSAGGYMIQKADYVLDFGRDDPRGLQCPLGAHVRRANPRDSLLPGDEQEIAIVNRHRLMRRGRNYQRDDGEKGLFFVAICEDLERQFEFVQRSWLQADGFHALKSERDPVVGQCPAGAGEFSIPTTGGTITVTGLSAFTTLRAGGYFFLPSRSALLYLANP